MKHLHGAILCNISYNLTLSSIAINIVRQVARGILLCRCNALKNVLRQLLRKIEPRFYFVQCFWPQKCSVTTCNFAYKLRDKLRNVAAALDVKGACKDDLSNIVLLNGTYI